MSSGKTEESKISRITSADVVAYETCMKRLPDRSLRAVLSHDILGEALTETLETDGTRGRGHLTMAIENDEVLQKIRSHLRGRIGAIVQKKGHLRITGTSTVLSLTKYTDS